MGVAATIHMGILELPVLDKMGAQTGKARYQLSNYNAVFDVAMEPRNLGKPYVDFQTKQEFPLSDGFNEILLEPTPEYLASVPAGWSVLEVQCRVLVPT